MDTTSRGRWLRRVLVSILAAQALLLVWEAWRVGITYDEPSHLAAAAMYWRGADVLQPSDTPPLTRIVGGWIPRLARMPLEADPAAWDSESSVRIGRTALAALGAGPARRLLFFARLPFVLFPLLVTWLLWSWGREIFGPGTALLLAAFGALEPTLLSHGPLVKSDVPAAAVLFLAAHRAWRQARRPDPGHAAKLSVAVVAAVLTKFSLLAFVPAALAVLLVWRPVRPWSRAASFLPALLLLPVLYVGILAASQFDRLGPIEADTLAKMHRTGFSAPEVAAARAIGALPWPEQFVRGVVYIAEMDRAERSFPAFMLGRPLAADEARGVAYFPLAWAVKFPIALQLLSLGGLGCAVHELVIRRRWRRAAFVWLPPLVLLAFALRSHIHIGFRHVLPCVPFAILGAGFALERLLAARAGRIGVAACAGWLALSSLAIYPQGIAYFNEWAGGPRNGWRLLADSNFDWGQSLPDLGRYVARRGLDRITLYYFGQDIPAHYVPREKLDERPPPLDPRLAPTPALDPAPGVYAVSVNLLLGYYAAPAYRDYFAAFRERAPADEVGYTILIYEVPDP